MRLTHIKLAGFKSFTDPTTIHVPSQLVAVIGPNGCGKSNVIDAVRWVLGEASAKQLRGESMQDVIFNGAATRRPAPRASVELVFDNSDGSLTGEWGRYAEVSIKRQLSRQGDSGYFINGQAVRRRDITDLFLGTGVGTKGYAVIEQGMISRIIEARPEDLRAYIEEAAGVSKYKERRRETEHRLKDTREHLQRLADLQTELARQVEKLERQAGTAERYQTLQSELNYLYDLSDYLAWQHALNQADAAQRQHTEAEIKHNEASEQIQHLNHSVQTLREQEQDEQAQLHRLHQEHALLREQMARLEEQIRAQRNQHQRAEKERLIAQAKVSELQQKQNQLQQYIELSKEKQEEQEYTLSERAIQLSEYEEQLPELEHVQQESQHHHQHCQNECSRFKSELVLKQQQRQQAENDLNKSTAQHQRLLDEQSKLNLPLPDELTQAQEQSLILQEHYTYTEEALLESEQHLETLKADFQAAYQQHQSGLAQILALQTQADALSQLIQSHSQDEYWCHTPQQHAPTVWQHIQIEEQWQHAISIVLAEHLHARALTADFFPEMLPENTSISWFNAQAAAPQTPLHPQSLLHHIQADHTFLALLHQQLSHYLAAPDLAYALAHRHQLQAQQIWITPEGHCIDAISTTLFSQSKHSQLIQYRHRHQHLQQEQAQLQPQIEAMQTRLEHLQTALQKQENHHRELTLRQREQARQLHTAQSRAAELLARTNQTQLRNEHIDIEIEQLVFEIQQNQLKINLLDQDIEDLQHTVNEWEQEKQASQAQHQQQLQKFKQSQTAFFEAKRLYGLAELEMHQIHKDLQHHQTQIALLQTQIEEWQERQTELSLVFEDETQQQTLMIQLDCFAEQSQTLQEQIDQKQSNLEHIQNQGRTSYGQLQALSAQQPQLQAAVQNALLLQQEALLQAKYHHDHLLERHADLEKLTQAAQHAESQDTQQRIQQLQHAITTLGAVNLAALEELEEARERDEYYRNQSQDIQQSIDLLEEAIAQIDNETKSRFKSTFDAVNQKVQNFFPTLFGGGEAKLQMIGDDLLTSGVAIMAQPPGKKNSTIHLLSGGEKALTAMSLVFALFSLNPAPFCLLDEVDAPLDDANTTRFCNLVKEMSAQTQFLYISHNRLTMEMADQLIGVTMQEKGVSRIVEVDIKQAMQMAEQAA